MGGGVGGAYVGLRVTSYTVGLTGERGGYWRGQRCRRRREKAGKGWGYGGEEMEWWLPLSCLSSVEVTEPSGFACVVFLLFEEKAPERAPPRLRFNPA